MTWLAGVGSRQIALGSAVVFLAVGACADDGGGADGSTGAAASEGPGGSSGPTSGPTSGDDVPDPTAGPAPGTGSGTATGDSTSGPAGSDSGSTAAPPVELCNGWQEDAVSPSLALYGSGHVALQSGGVLAIECGGQGSWMFPIYPEMGGWDLAGGTYVTFSVTIDVEGFAGPSGHFYDFPDLTYGVECFGGDEFDGGFGHACIAVFPPDDVVDLATLDGAPTTIHVEMVVPGGDPIVVDLVDMTLSAPAAVVGQECFF